MRSCSPALRSAGVWWAYPLLWLVPLLTWMMVITRIRNIAEHAVVPDSDDPLRNTRTTRANLIERALIAPYFVNYHLEHHLLYYVPCYNLPKLHAILMRGPHAARMEVQPNYLSVLRLATAKPDQDDRPGEIDARGAGAPARAPARIRWPAVFEYETSRPTPVRRYAGTGRRELSRERRAIRTATMTAATSPTGACTKG